MFTPKQIEALKYMIINAKDGTELSKRVLLFLIDSSEGLTKEVCLSLVADREGYAADEIRGAGHGVDHMLSCSGTTHLHSILDVMGSELFFNVHYGDFDPTRTGGPVNSDGQFAGHDVSQVSDPGHVRRDMPARYTFWLSKKHYSWQATLTTAGRERLDLIDLKKRQFEQV